MDIKLENASKKGILYIWVSSLTVIALAFASACVVFDFLWDKHFQVTHTSLELVCVYIEFTAFSIIWNTFERSNTVNHLIGFGFLIVGIFDVIHIYLFLFVSQNSLNIMQLANNYWAAGRIIEAILILAVSMKLFNAKITKWIGTAVSFGIIAAVSIVILYLPLFFDFLKQYELFNTISMLMEYSILSVYGFCLIKLRREISNMEVITYKYIFIAVLIAVPTELCVMLGSNSRDFYSLLDHILKLCSSYFLYKGLFISAIAFPYKKVEEIRSHIESILNALPIAILTYDANQRVNFANTRFEELLGCSREFVCGFSTQDVVRSFPNVGDSQDEDYIINEVLAGRKDEGSYVRTFKSFSGAEVKLAVSAQKLKNGVLVMLRDVKKEQELENIQLQTQTIVNAISQAVIIIDKYYRVIIYNETFQELFEISELDAIKGRKMSELMKLVNDYGKNDTPKEIRYKSDISFDTYVVTRSGARKELLANISRINNVDGELLGWVGVATDITERIREQQNIQQQEKLALIGQMAAGIVHEIKNPLATIKGFNQIIKSKLDDEKLVKYAAAVENAINDVSKVANDFLSFAKPRPSVVREVSLNNMLQSMQLMISSHAFTRSIKTCFTLSETEELIEADEGQIKQVILNLCENAIDALNQAEDPVLRISSVYDEQAKEMIVRIADNGKGIHPDDLHKVGTPFFTTKEKGTGLGISICYQIINKHGGKIEIESGWGKGTTFIISLPCKKNTVEI